MYNFYLASYAAHSNTTPSMTGLTELRVRNFVPKKITDSESEKYFARLCLNDVNRASGTFPKQEHSFHLISRIILFADECLRLGLQPQFDTKACVVTLQFGSQSIHCISQ